MKSDKEFLYDLAHTVVEIGDVMPEEFFNKCMVQLGYENRSPEFKQKVKNEILRFGIKVQG